MRLPLLAVFFVSLLGASQQALAQTTIPLWPDNQTKRATALPEKDTTTEKETRVAGRRVTRLTNVSTPTITVYRPSLTPNGAAVVVFPGGGYRILAYDLEGTEVCDWLTSKGVTCVLVKYRVPHTDRYPKTSANLADAQRAVRLTRQHATEWHIDSKHVGVLGFSAGGHLAALVSNRAAEKVYEPGDASDQLSARPDFVFLIYPAYLAALPELTRVAPEVAPTAQTPPTFLVQTEDDPIHVECSLVYYQALKAAKVPADLHVFARGGHGYGLRSTELPVTKWPRLAMEWLEHIETASARR